MTIQNILVILISYFIGSLLPAELVSWVVKRRPCSEIGSGNPGFANITSSLGVFAGLIVLAGDIGKTYLGMRVAYDFTRGDTLLLTSLLSLCALVTGHNFPLWNLFCGGKGVTVTCTGIILITPTLGIPAVLIGFVIVLLTGWLPLGALVIPASYFLMCAFLLPEAVPFAIFLTAMMLLRHLPGLVSIFTGKCERVSPFDIFKKDKRMVDEPQPEVLPEEVFAANADLPDQPAAGSVEDAFIASMLAEDEIPLSEDEAPADLDKTAGDEHAVSSEAEVSSAVDSSESSPSSDVPSTEVGEAASVKETASGENEASTNPSAADTEDTPALWSVPMANDRDSKKEPVADSNPAADTQASSGDSSASKDSNEAAKAALWKTGILPSLEELRRHGLRSMKDIPEAKASSSLLQGRRHAHRSTTVKETVTSDDVIFYNLGEEKSKTPTAAENKDTDQ